MTELNETLRATHYVLGDDIGSIVYVSHDGTDKRIVNAARVSFGQDNDGEFNDRDRRLLHRLLKDGHGSPLEHTSITFKVVAPLYVAQQWMRHRIASYNAISARYVEVQDNFYVPEAFREQSKSNRQASSGWLPEPETTWAKAFYERTVEYAYRNYQHLLELGVPREQARGILPMCMYTEFYVTMNLRAWLHFVDLRDHDGAQQEIRVYAKKIKELLEQLFPATMEAYYAVNVAIH